MPRRQTALDAEREGRKPGFDGDPALRELLDHVARQLAEEYVRLMKEAARADGVSKEAANEVTR